MESCHDWRFGPGNLRCNQSGLMKRDASWCFKYVFVFLKKVRRDMEQA